MKYPNGQNYLPHITKQSASRRGMSLEKDINSSNEFYLAMDKAIIYKKPTPVQVVKVDYQARSKAKIVEAYYKIPSTVDYSGIYKGRHLDFEAKESHSKTSFPFSSIHKHQIDYLDKIIKHGGIGFVIVRFTHYDKTYLVEGDKIINEYRYRESRSLPYDWFIENGHLIDEGLHPRLDYLKVVEKLYFKEDIHG